MGKTNFNLKEIFMTVPFSEKVSVLSFLSKCKGEKKYSQKDFFHTTKSVSRPKKSILSAKMLPIDPNDMEEDLNNDDMIDIPFPTTIHQIASLFYD